MIAAGVARPIAQGQAMIITETAATRALLKRGSGPMDIQTRKVRPDKINTTGTKTAVILSTIAWIGSFAP